MNSTDLDVPPLPKDALPPSAMATSSAPSAGIGLYFVGKPLIIRQSPGHVG